MRSEIEKAWTKLMYWNVNVGPKIDPLLKSMLSIEPLRRPTARIQGSYIHIRNGEKRRKSFN